MKVIDTLPGDRVNGLVWVPFNDTIWACSSDSTIYVYARTSGNVLKRIMTATPASSVKQPRVAANTSRNIPISSTPRKRDLKTFTNTTKKSDVRPTGNEEQGEDGDDDDDFDEPEHTLQFHGDYNEADAKATQTKKGNNSEIKSAEQGTVEIRVEGGHKEHIFVLGAYDKFVWSGGFDKKLRVWEAQVCRFVRPE